MALANLERQRIYDQVFDFNILSKNFNNSQFLEVDMKTFSVQ